MNSEIIWTEHTGLQVPGLADRSRYIIRDAAAAAGESVMAGKEQGHARGVPRCQQLAARDDQDPGRLPGWVSRFDRSFCRPGAGKPVVVRPQNFRFGNGAQRVLGYVDMRSRLRRVRDLLYDHD